MCQNYGLTNLAQYWRSIDLFFGPLRHIARSLTPVCVDRSNKLVAEINRHFQLPVHFRGLGNGSRVESRKLDLGNRSSLALQRRGLIWAQGRSPPWERLHEGRRLTEIRGQNLRWNANAILASLRGASIIDTPAIPLEIGNRSTVAPRPTRPLIPLLTDFSSSNLSVGNFGLTKSGSRAFLSIMGNSRFGGSVTIDTCGESNAPPGVVKNGE